MKATILIILGLVALSIAHPLTDSAWKLYKTKFNKNYETQEEEARRYVIFKRNMHRVLQLNQIDTAHHSWTKYSDMENSELFSRIVVPKNIIRTKITPRNDLPDSYDWRDKGAVNEVKDQAQCGSCWAFCATASIESANFIKNSQLLSLAEQQIVDCDTEDSGCGGGWPQRAMDYVHQAGGQELEPDYPYTALTGKCKANPSLFKGTVSQSYTFEDNEEAIMEAVMQHGVVSVAVDASKFNSYSSGIMNGKNCMQHYPDHGVAIVGWGSENGVKYWIIRNSWGKSWGEHGYVRLQRGIDACGVEEYPMGCDA